MQLAILLALCGIALADDTYIINGDDVTMPGKYPWQGSLRRFGSHSCGISLISKNWGVCAAHCTQSSLSGYSFRFGSNNRLSGGVLVGAKRIINHERYGSGSGAFPNDISLVEFDESVTGANIGYVPLAVAGSEHSGNPNCWITGWGRNENGVLPVTLQEANINVYTQARCREDWGNTINSGHVCIGDTVNGRTSCNGDSGGPLVCEVGGRFELVGATSWGPAGCGSHLPAGYSRIAYFRQWIKDNSGI